MTPGRVVTDHDYNTTRYVAAAALGKGARKVSVTRIAWNAAGNCSCPVTVERFARPGWQVQPDAAGSFLRSVQQFYPDAKLTRADVPVRGRSRDQVITREGKIPVWLVSEVPCRKCGNCLARRRRMWSIRAQHEYSVAPRTWFGTLTVGPNAMQAALNNARRLVAANQTLDAVTGEFLNDDYDKLSAAERGQRLHAQFSPDITRYLKRVRKGDLPHNLCPLQAVGCLLADRTVVKGRFWEAWETKFRFLCVAEIGEETDRLHYHMLLHELVDGPKVRRALLSNQWSLGFTDWKLVNSASQATYVCKYLSKSLLARVRASKDYGQIERPRDIDESRASTTTERASFVSGERDVRRSASLISPQIGHEDDALRTVKPEQVKA